MSVHEIAVKCAAYLAHELELDRIKENRMAFGMELFLGEIIKLTLTITISYILGILPEVLTITFTAGILRLASGGEHCSAYYRCLLGGTFCFILLGALAHLLNPLISNTALLLIVCISFLIGCILLLKYAPGDTANKPINSSEQRALFKKRSLQIMGIYLIIILAMMMGSAVKILVLPMVFGIIEQIFTVTPWGYHYIHWVDRVLGNKAEVQ